jgi:restriction endonuclease S subunit
MFEVMLKEINGSRFDCDYYAYKYEILQEAILKAKTKNINEIDSVVSIIKSGKTPSSHEYSDIETSFPIIKAGSYTNEYINLDKLGYTKEENNFEVQKGDIFILSAAHQSHYVGRQIKLLNEDVDIKISYVGELICIRTIEELCHPMYLFSLLNLEIYKTLLNREKTGQTSHIYGKDIKKIKIPLPSIEKQNEIAKHIQAIRDKAKQLTKEAKVTLENAKFEVEKMILG